MNSTFLQVLAAWLLTYALHSTVLLGLAWAIVRGRRVEPAVADVLWKAALVGGLITATSQAAFDLRPSGTFSLVRGVATEIAPIVPADLEREASRSITPPPVPSDAATTSAPTHGASTAPSAGLTAPRSLPTLFAIIWLAAATLLVVTYTARRLVLIGRLGDRRLLDSGDLPALLTALCRETGVRTPIRLTASHAISSPVALGTGEICLPAAALDELEPAQQRAMLAHELAHLVRRDPQWLAVACLMERALFFQPLNRLARRGIQASAEYLADEWAARRAGGVPLARALVKVAEWIQASPLGVPVAGFAEERSQLTQRVARLLDRSTWHAPRSRWGIGALALSALALMTAFAPGVAGTLREAVLPSGSPSTDLLAEAAPEQSAAETRTSTVETRSSTTSTTPVSPLTTAQGDTSVVRAVIARLRDEDVDVRRTAADVLGRLKNPAAIGPLVEALDDEDQEVRRAALNSLSQFERGVPTAPIRRLLSATDAETRGQAAGMLGEMRDRGSIPAITALLSDPSAEVRHEALHALEHLEAPVADDLIGRALTDRSTEVRQAAAQFAGERRMVSLVAGLITMLEDSSGDVRESAAQALTEMRTEASHRALRMALTHRDARVRRVAVEYLGDEDDR